MNIVIYSGPGDGYESSFRDIFEHNTFIGFATVAVLVAGPVVGVVIARRQRSQRST